MPSDTDFGTAVGILTAGILTPAILVAAGRDAIASSLGADGLIAVVAVVFGCSSKRGRSTG